MFASLLVALMSANLGAGFYVANSTKELLQARRTGEALDGELKAASGVQVSFQPLSDTDYRKVADTLAPTTPGLEFKVEQGKLTVSAKDVSSYAVWKYALSQVMTAQPGVRWKAADLCTGDCAGIAFSASLTGERFSINVTN